MKRLIKHRKREVVDKMCTRAELMEDLVMFQPDPDYEDDSIYLTRHADWPCGETDKTE